MRASLAVAAAAKHSLNVATVIGGVKSRPVLNRVSSNAGHIGRAL